MQVKFDRLQKTTSGQPIFAIDEETAREIRATFIIDVALLRSYGRETRLPENFVGPPALLGLARQQKEFLLAFALWKIRELLSTTFSYRSGCKLRMQTFSITTDGEKLGDDPFLTELPLLDIGAAITAAGFAAEPITRVYYPFGDLFRPSKDDASSRTTDEPESEAESEG